MQSAQFVAVYGLNQNQAVGDHAPPIELKATMATALTLLIIRHAEKPGEYWPGDGFTDKGEVDKESLVLRGWQRAGAWAALFGAALGGADYPKPNAIFAATPGAPDKPGHGPSRRPWETVIPLSARLGLQTNIKFGKGDEGALVAALAKLDGVVLVTWEHQAIVKDLLPKLWIDHGKPPTDWHGKRFDVVLRFDRPEGSDTFAYRPLYPQLLSGDLATPVDA